jgi:16S rRNA (uracil1498-N3)-methyltransferase
VSRPRAFVETAALQGDRVTLTGDGYHHVRRVLRLGPGDPLELFDGAGLVAQAIIDGAPDRSLILRIEQRHLQPPPAGPIVTLVCAELKGDKMDLVLQKTTELGVDRIVPVTTARSVPRPAAEARKRRHARRHKVVREACRQCGRAYLPEVHPSLSLAEALDAHAHDEAFVLWESTGAGGLAAALAGSTAPSGIALLVGPEGGFTAEEVASARDHGFEEVSLGRHILRADTAALAAVTLAGAHLGRLG